MKLWIAAAITGIILGAGCRQNNPVQSNLPPVIMDTRAAFRVVEVGSMVTDTIRAADPEGDEISYALMGVPGHVSLNENVVTWVPSISDTGNRVISVLVKDAQGGTAIVALSYSVRISWVRLIQLVAEEIKNEVVLVRGKPFLRAVSVLGKTREEFVSARNAAGGIGGGMTPAEKEAANKVLAMEGFLRPGEDIFAETDSMLGGSVGGFYIPGSDSLWVIIADTGRGLDTNIRVTLFHEYVHALQDQYYGIKSMESRATSSDQAYAIRYFLEGEAAFLEWFYLIKLWEGAYPSWSTVRSFLPFYETDVNAYLDTMHHRGERYFVTAPFIYAYVYGPMFIANVVSSWNEIDSKIFTRPPVRCREVMNSSMYLANNRYGYIVGLDSLMEAVESTRHVLDYDEFGSLYTGILLREWGNKDWKDISLNLISDRIVVSGTPAGDSLSLCWVTHWPNVAYRDKFKDAYLAIMRGKYGAIAGPSLYTADVIIDDSTQMCYLETKGNNVYVMEKYPRGDREKWIDRMRKASVENWGSMGKITRNDSKRYPRVKKEKVIDKRSEKVPIKMF